jgi:glycosyltransferase involved in cell wall biosynthesis
MRILHIVGGLDRGGAETWLVQVLRHVDRRTHPMDFLVHGDQPGAYEDEVRALGARVLRCVGPSSPLRYAWQLRRILREYGPYDCVHAHIHQASGYVLLLAAAMHVPHRIAHSHLDTRDLDRRSSWLRRAYVSAMGMLVRRFATAGFAVSDAAARSLFSESWRSDPRVSLCPLGIDLRSFDPEVASSEVRAQLGIPAGSFVVGHTGRFCEQKNHCFLVDIAERFLRIQPGAVFLLVGDGPLRPAIEQMMHARGLGQRFIFTGVRGDVPRLMMGAMDCFLFPSLYEGLGLVLWEAQAAGLECVVSENVPWEADAIPEQVTRLSMHAPPARWADALGAVAKRSVSGSRRNKSCSLRMQAYSIEASVGHLLRLYEDAANAAPSYRGIAEVAP